MNNRTLAVAALLCAALAPAALASFASIYTGEFPELPGSAAKLKTTDRADGEYFKSFVAEDVTVPCEGNAELELETAFVRGLVPLDRHGDFKAKGTDEEETIKVRGTVEGNKATGTWSYVGVASSSGTTADCEARRLAWKVKT